MPDSLGPPHTTATAVLRLHPKAVLIPRSFLARSSSRIRASRRSCATPCRPPQCVRPAAAYQACPPQPGIGAQPSDKRCFPRSHRNTEARPSVPWAEESGNMASPAPARAMAHASNSAGRNRLRVKRCRGKKSAMRRAPQSLRLVALKPVTTGSRASRGPGVLVFTVVCTNFRPGRSRNNLHSRSPITGTASAPK
jgi:hypothetical protein